jgi:hypothetical protein
MDELFNIINIDDILCGAYLTPAFIISYRYKATFPIVAGLFLIFHAERSRRAPLEGKTGKHSPNGHFGPGPYQLSVFFFFIGKNRCALWFVSVEGALATVIGYF